MEPKYPIRAAIAASLGTKRAPVPVISPAIDDVAQHAYETWPQSTPASAKKIKRMLTRAASKCLQIEKGTTRNTVVAAIEQLPGIQKRALVSHTLNPGVTHAQIADVLQTDREEMLQELADAYASVRSILE